MNAPEVHHAEDVLLYAAQKYAVFRIDNVLKVYRVSKREIFEIRPDLARRVLARGLPWKQKPSSKESS